MMNGGPGNGIYTGGVGAGLVIQGNYVGTNITGTAALANHYNGIAWPLAQPSSPSAGPPPVRATFSLATASTVSTSAGKTEPIPTPSSSRAT